MPGKAWDGWVTLVGSTGSSHCMFCCEIVPSFESIGSREFRVRFNLFSLSLCITPSILLHLHPDIQHKWKIYTKKQTRNPAVDRIANVLIVSDLQGHPWSMIFIAIWNSICHFLLVTNSNLDPISHHFQHMAIDSSKLSIENCSQTAWLLQTAYKKLPLPYLMVPSLLYLMVPSLTLYDLLFRHNITRLAYHTALWPYKIIQGKWFMSFENQYATY